MQSNKNITQPERLKQPWYSSLATRPPDPKGTVVCRSEGLWPRLLAIAPQQVDKRKHGIKALGQKIVK